MTPLPPDKTEPPVEVAYQSIVAPEEAEAFIITGPAPDLEFPVHDTTFGNVFTVTVTTFEYIVPSVVVVAALL